MLDWIANWIKRLVVRDASLNLNSVFSGMLQTRTIEIFTLSAFVYFSMNSKEKETFNEITNSIKGSF
jgi:hypothetical protein